MTVNKKLMIFRLNGNILMIRRVDKENTMKRIVGVKVLIPMAIDKYNTAGLLRTFKMLKDIAKSGAEDYLVDIPNAKIIDAEVL